MTRTQFASLNQSVFAVVVAKRLRLVQATKEVDRLVEACPCDRGCRCSLRQAIAAAKQVESDAYHAARVAEAAYAEYHAIRRS